MEIDCYCLFFGNMEKNNIIPLNEKNFPTWKIQMKMHLIGNDLFSIVDGTELEPSSENESAQSASAHKKFCVRRDKALATIVLAVDPSLLYLLGDPTDPADVWKKLTDIFQKKTWANKLRLRRKLYSMKLKSGCSLQEHLKEFVELFSEMAVIDDVMEEEVRVICLLATLPERCSIIVTSYIRSV